MHIRGNGHVVTMSEGLVCKNYGDMRHGIDAFEKVGVYDYRCGTCGLVMTVGEPIVIIDDRGRVRMEVPAEYRA